MRKTTKNPAKPAARRDPTKKADGRSLLGGWIHRGTKSRRLRPGEKLPAGWKTGRGSTHGR